MLDKLLCKHFHKKEITIRDILSIKKGWVLTVLLYLICIVSFREMLVLYNINITMLRSAVIVTKLIVIVTIIKGFYEVLKIIINKIIDTKVAECPLKKEDKVE